MTYSPGRNLVAACGMTLGLLASSATLFSRGVSDEQRVRSRIDEGVEAGRRGDLAALRAFISANYLDARGMDRQALLGMLALYLRGGDSLHLLARTHRVRVIEAGRVEATVLLAVADLPVEDLESLKQVSADLLWIELVFAYEGDWNVLTAEWREASLRDFLVP